MKTSNHWAYMMPRRVGGTEERREEGKRRKKILNTMLKAWGDLA